MAEQEVVRNGKLMVDFLYEGEALALEYPDGTLIPIPDNKIYMFLMNACTTDGEACKIVMAKSPLTHLPIVVVDK